MSKPTKKEMLEVLECLIYAYWNTGEKMKCPKNCVYQEFINRQDAIRRLIEQKPEQGRPKVSELTREEMIEQLVGWRYYCGKGEEGTRGCRESCGKIHMEKCLQNFQAIRRLLSGYPTDLFVTLNHKQFYSMFKEAGVEVEEKEDK